MRLAGGEPLIGWSIPRLQRWEVALYLVSFAGLGVVAYLIFGGL
jgi:hypothetical protein